jgi:hypothetical protein
MRALKSKRWRAKLGADVGETVGRLVATTGDRVPIMGAHEGPILGAVVGAMVEGAVVGTPVGRLVGVRVEGARVTAKGAPVGWVVGARVGTFVGAAKGAPVGHAVGAMVGEAGRWKQDRTHMCVCERKREKGTRR